MDQKRFVTLLPPLLPPRFFPAPPVLAPRHFSARRRSHNGAAMEEAKNGELNPNSFPLADSELLLKDADVEVSAMVNLPRVL